MAIETNDNLMAMYIASLVRSVIALHHLINNKQELQKKKVDRAGPGGKRIACDPTLIPGQCLEWRKPRLGLHEFCARFIPFYSLWFEQRPNAQALFLFVPVAVGVDDSLVSLSALSRHRLSLHHTASCSLHTVVLRQLSQNCDRGRRIATPYRRIAKCDPLSCAGCLLAVFPPGWLLCLLACWVVLVFFRRAFPFCFCSHAPVALYARIMRTFLLFFFEVILVPKSMHLVG